MKLAAAAAANLAVVPPSICAQLPALDPTAAGPADRIWAAAGKQRAERKR